MAALPETDVFRSAVARELRLQFTRSMKRKLLMLTVAVLAIGVVVGLDKLKVQLVDAREKPYLAADVTRAIGKTNPELAAAAKKLRQERRYADVETVFAALLSQTTYASEAAAEQAAIRLEYKERLKDMDRGIRAAAVASSIAGAAKAEEMRSVVATLRARRAELISTRTAELAEAKKDAEDDVKKAYAGQLADIDKAIRDAVMAEPLPDGKAADQAKTLLATLKLRRGELVAARAAELSEAEQNAAARTATLRRAFDETNAAEIARSNFRVSKNPRVSRFVEHVVDPDHPLSIIYDVLWYAGLVIGVLAFVALLLTPLFKALPVTGAEEPIMEQVRNLFSRGPRGFGAGAVRVAAMTIGTAAIVSVATTAPSSPLVESALLASSTIEAEASEQQKVPEVSKVQEPRKGSETPRAETAAPCEPCERKPDGEGLPPETRVEDPPKDPRFDDLLGSISQLQADNTSHKQALAEQKETLGKLEPLRERVEKIASSEQEQVEQLENYFDATDDAIEKTKKAAEIANARAVLAESAAATAGAQLGEARKYLEERADAIDEAISLPYKVGERSGFLTSVLSFERYRVTAASVTFVEKAGAPEKVVAATRSLQGAGDMSNDALRLALRQELCGKPSNCDLHVAWRDIVLRAARRQ